MTTVLFLHGFGEDRSIWDDFVKQFDWELPIEIIDYANWQDCTSIAAYAAKIKTKLKQNSYFIVGHSMGGYIALEMAEQFPELIQGVVMVNSTAKADTPEKQENRNKTIDFLHTYGTEKFIVNFLPNMFASSKIEQHKVLIEQLTNRFKHLSKEALVIATESMKNRKDFQTFLQSTTIPFLFIAGEEDSFFSPESILEFLQFPGSNHTLVSLPFVGHHATYEAPAALHYLLAEFFESK